MIITCWRGQISEPPVNVKAETTCCEPEGRYFTPFWLISFAVSVKFPLIKTPQHAQFQLAVNAITGNIAYPPLTEAVEIEASDSEIVPVQVSWETIKKDRYIQALNGKIHKKARLMAKISYDMQNVSLVYKQTSLWHVEFHNHSQCTIAVDTLTGEYGIVHKHK